MISVLFLLVIVVGGFAALRPERATSLLLARNSEWLGERYVRHFILSTRIVGMGWVLFGAVFLTISLNG